MKELLVRPIFKTHGFESGKEITEEEFENLKEEFISMHNCFARLTNPLMDKINESWANYEEIEEMSKIINVSSSLDQIRKAMEINDNTRYCDWVKKWYDEVCKEMERLPDIKKLNIRPYIFIEDENPILGARLKQNENWWFEMFLKMIE